MTSLMFRRYLSTLPVRRNFRKLCDRDVQFFESILDPANVLGSHKNDNLDAYNTDWLHIYKGNSSIVLRPKTTEQVSVLLKYCNEKHLAVVPQGGNTGLVGGSVPVFDEVILNMSLMNKIYSCNDEIGFVSCQSGVVLRTLDDYAATRGRIVPLDLGAKESCHIGGNLSTNAGGLRLLRYGSLRGNVLSLQAVMANGQVLQCSSPLRKDNTGVDLKQLFIGSEGTLGVITEVAILCPPRPAVTNVAMFACDSAEKAIRCYKHSQKFLCEILSAFELIDKQSMQCTEANLGLKNPFSATSEKHRYYILLETSGSKEEHDSEKLQDFCQFLIDHNEVEDGIVAQDVAQAQNLWHLRESIAEAFLRGPAWFPLDVSLSSLSNEITELEKYVTPFMKQLGVAFSLFGHVGDGRLAVDETMNRFASFWALRERLAEALKRIGHTYKYDVSLATLEHFFLLIDVMRERLSDRVEACVGYGHMGDGNLHLNFVSQTFDQEIKEKIEPYIYSWIQKHGGSISAEHGLGQMKAPYLSYSKSPEAIEYMRSLKATFDPNGILNPYKFLPSH